MFHVGLQPDKCQDEGTAKSMSSGLRDIDWLPVRFMGPSSWVLPPLPKLDTGQ